MAVRSISNTFNRGELDPTLFARDDIEIYTKGARKLRNIIPLWTGSARIAPGTKYVDVVVDRENDNALITNHEEIKGVDFLFNSDEDVVYTLILRKSGSVSAFDIYFNDTLQATVVVDYTPAQIKDVYFAPAQDRILVLHQSHQIRQLTRTSHTSWTSSFLTPRAFPTFDFSTIGLAPSYQGITFTLGDTKGNNISLNADADIFVHNHIGGLFVGNGGVGRIIAVNSTDKKLAAMDILEDFESTTVKGSLASLQEKLWNTDTTTTPVSQNRGWPSRGVFYLNRLMLGRAIQTHNIVAISTAGVYDNFDISDLDALSSFIVSFNGKGEQSIQSMVADDSIIFLTTGKVYAQSPLVEEPLSPLNAYFAPQTQSPCTNIEAVTVDNQILYVDSTRSQVMQLAYSTADAKYLGVPAGLLSSHLFNAVNSNGSWEPKGISARLYLATQDDGTMLMYSTLVEQQVAGWSLRNTRGKFTQVIGDGRQASVLVERQVNLGATTFETTPDFAYLSDPTFKSFFDVQSFFESSSSSAIGVLENNHDYVVLGNDVPFTAIDIDFNLEASDDCDLVFEYLDGNGFWDVFTPTDNTTGFTANGSIVWTFDDVLNWSPNTVNAIEEKYWIRIKRTKAEVTTTPVIEQVEVNTGNRIYLERMDFDLYTDSTMSRTSSSTGAVTGLTHVAGQQVYAIENGATTGPYFVESDGTTTIKNLNATVQIGIQYTPLLIPMPLFTPTQEGDNTYAQKYVQDLFVDYVDSLYLKAGIGQQLTDIPNMKLGNYTLGQAVSPQTGIYDIHPRGDWNPRQEFIVTQSQPGPMTIIGIGYHVEVS